MDLQEQLQRLFPEHTPEPTPEKTSEHWWQTQPLLCKFEKRNGKPQTVIEGFMGADADFKALTKELKTTLGVGGSYKNDTIILQGNYRDQIMQILKDKGFTVKRVGG